VTDTVAFFDLIMFPKLIKWFHPSKSDGKLYPNQRNTSFHILLIKEQWKKRWEHYSVGPKQKIHGRSCGFSKIPLWWRATLVGLLRSNLQPKTLTLVGPSFFQSFWMAPKSQHIWIQNHRIPHLEQQIITRFNGKKTKRARHAPSLIITIRVKRTTC
jgi:hypothetical protein